MTLNTREIAILVWLTLAIVGILIAKSTRPAFINLIHALFQRKIVYVVGLASLYTSTCVWALWKVGIWNLPNLKTVVLWFFTTAFVSMANTKALETGPAIFHSLVREAIAITAIVTFVSGIYTLPLWAELSMLPFLFAVTAMTALAEHKHEHKKVLGLLNTILGISGLFILGYSIFRILSDWQNLDPAHQAREFAIPIALTLMFLPFLYSIMIYVGFENAAIRLSFKIKDPKLRRSIWWHGCLAFGLRPQAFSRFIHAVQMSDVRDSDGVGRLVATLRRAERRERMRPAVDWRFGWSPDEAGDFLKIHGLSTKPYHPLLMNWTAESVYLKLSNEVLHDTIIYRIDGTETAATELELELDARCSDSSNLSDEQFWISSLALIENALGDETSERFSRAIPCDINFEMTAGKVIIQLRRDDWSVNQRSGYSRKLTIRHPAHRDPFALA